MPRGSYGGQTLKYEVGYLRSVPIPSIDTTDKPRLEQCAKTSYELFRSLSTTSNTSHVFCLPALLQVTGDTLVERIAGWLERLDDTEQRLAYCQRQIDEIAFKLYGIEREDRLALELAVANRHRAVDTEEFELNGQDETTNIGQLTTNQEQLVAELFSYSMGCVVGRWDIRFAAGEKPQPELPDPFDPLPACSPGMLQGNDGLPLTETPGGYSVRIHWDGILVDDPDHSDDIIRRVRDVLEVIWKDRADSIEKEACEILGVADLRDYFRKPGAGGFWDDHVKRYSKSRRKAPIYWLLQSSKKNYALWIYYHRLDKDIVFKALLNYVEPKIRREESRLDELRSQKTALGPAAKGAKKLDKDIDRQEAFLSELRDFEDKLRWAANLHLDPDLNDGVVLNIAPLRELVPWKEAKSYWDELMGGKYEWSSIGKQLREKGVVPC